MSYAGIYYLFTMVGTIHAVLVVLMVISLILTVGNLFSLLISYDTMQTDLNIAAKIGLKYVIPITLVLSVLVVLVPSRKDAAIIAGLYLGQGPIEKTIDGLGEVTPLLLDALKEELLSSKKEVKNE